MTPQILITGAAGYIGSHIALEFLQKGYDVICIDNLRNAFSKTTDEKPEALKRVEKLAKKSLQFYKGDLLDKRHLIEIFKKHKIDYVFHLAALKAVGVSCKIPIDYYQTNIAGTTNLLEVMDEMKCFNLIFASSSTVYGDSKTFPTKEEDVTGVCNCPYGRSKYFCEEILKDVCISNNKWKIIALRYFNPVGAHSSGEIGENSTDAPTNLLPYICEVATGKRASLKIFGSDYDTHDGTAVRDYVHIMDLAQAHLNVLEKFESGTFNGFKAYNLCGGKGYTVLDMVTAFREVSGKPIPYELVPRRTGDVPKTLADRNLAKQELGWVPKLGLKEMCADVWKWQTQNPNGYL